MVELRVCGGRVARMWGLTWRSMELREGLRTTGSVRAFTDEAVTPEQVSAVLETARFAPSGGNKQGWHVIWVRDAADACGVA